MRRPYNFSAGPATLPEPVLKQAQEELLEWHNIGASVAEISHRSPEFIALAHQVEIDLRNLLSIPDNYSVLFLSGGATTQQALLPINFASGQQTADYVVTGHWSKVAVKQAAPYVNVHIAANGESRQFRSIPDYQTWDFSTQAAYVHITANETIHGVEYRSFPKIGAVPVFADFSSSIASEPIDISSYGLIYAGAQKNLGPVGICVVIVRNDLLERKGQQRADIFTYASHAAHGSMLNTPPTWNWYLLGLTVRWMLDQGGVAEFDRRNHHKSTLIYETIDQSGGFYKNHVDTKVRSRMNIPFFLSSPQQDADFVAKAKDAGLLALKGHKAIGGVRASLYNAMPVEGARALKEFMLDYQQRYG